MAPTMVDSISRGTPSDASDAGASPSSRETIGTTDSSEARANGAEPDSAENMVEASE